MPRKYEKEQDLLPVVKDMVEAGYTYRQIAGRLGLGGKEVIEELLKRERRKAAHGVPMHRGRKPAKTLQEYKHMKREFLQNFKIGEQALPKEIIDSILDEDGRDIEAAKKPFADYEALKEQLNATKDGLAAFKDVASKHGVGIPEFYGEMAKAFLFDKDAKSPKDKMSAYYYGIVMAE